MAKRAEQYLDSPITASVLGSVVGGNGEMNLEELLHESRNCY
jgi:hypothetical protein